LNRHRVAGSRPTRNFTTTRHTQTNDERCLNLHRYECRGLGVKVAYENTRLELHRISPSSRLCIPPHPLYVQRISRHSSCQRNYKYAQAHPKYASSKPELSDNRGNQNTARVGHGLVIRQRRTERRTDRVRSSHQRDLSVANATSGSVIDEIGENQINAAIQVSPVVPLVSELCTFENRSVDDVNYLNTLSLSNTRVKRCDLRNVWLRKKMKRYNDVTPTGIHQSRVTAVLHL